MGIYRKKTWTDSVIEAANRAETEEEKMVQGMIILVLCLRESPYFKMDRGPWFPPPEFDLTTKGGITEYNEYSCVNEVKRNLIESLRSEYNQSLLFVWDHWTDKDKPQLKLIPYPDKQIFCELIKNLQDPDWITALCYCAECKNFMLSVSKWAKTGKKFCSKKCREKYYGRKNKKNGREKRETIEEEQVSKILEHPGNLNEYRIKRNCLKCDKSFIAEGRFNRICPRCKLK